MQLARIAPMPQRRPRSGGSPRTTWRQRSTDRKPRTLVAATDPSAQRQKHGEPRDRPPTAPVVDGTMQPSACVRRQPRIGKCRTRTSEILGGKSSITELNGTARQHAQSRIGGRAKSRAGAGGVPPRTERRLPCADRDRLKTPEKAHFRSSTPDCSNESVSGRLRKAHPGGRIWRSRRGPSATGEAAPTCRVWRGLECRVPGAAAQCTTSPAPCISSWPRCRTGGSSGRIARITAMARYMSKICVSAR